MSSGPNATVAHNTLRSRMDRQPSDITVSAKYFKFHLHNLVALLLSHLFYCFLNRYLIFSIHIHFYFVYLDINFDISLGISFAVLKFC